MAENVCVCYIPMLEGQSDMVNDWLQGVPDRYGILPLMLPPVDWNDDLTPWPAGPVFKKGKPFGGQAAKYLERLEGEIIPSMEAGLQVGQRWMLGISLSGLFAVWAAAKCDLFTGIAAISGSFWYPGFTEWLKEQQVAVRQVYLSLGDKETETKNIHLKDIAVQTARVVEILRTKSVDTQFEWTEGTHFGPLIPRLEKSFEAIARSVMR